MHYRRLSTVIGLAGVLSLFVFVSSTKLLLASNGASAEPIVWATVPVNNSTAVKEDQNLSIIFNDVVQAGEGSVHIMRNSSSQIVEQISIDSDRITGWGTNVITIDPQKNFQYDEETYYIDIEDGAILTSQGEMLANFNGSSNWRFTTLDEASDTLLPNAVRVRSTGGSSCTTSNDIQLQIVSTNMQDVIVSESPQFFGAEWKRMTYPYLLDFTLSSGDGEKVLHIRTRSSDGSVMLSSTQFSITLDSLYNCNQETQGPIPPEVPEGSDRLVYVEEINSYYLIDPEGSRHFISNNHIFDSWKPVLPAAELISLEELQVYGIGTVMSERPGAVLLKFGVSPEIYHVEENPEDRFKPIIRHIDVESTATAMYGVGWQSLITEQSDALKYLYRIGDEINGSNYYVINP